MHRSYVRGIDAPRGCDEAARFATIHAIDVVPVHLLPTRRCYVMICYFQGCWTTGGSA